MLYNNSSAYSLITISKSEPISWYISEPLSYKLDFYIYLYYIKELVSSLLLTKSLFDNFYVLQILVLFFDQFQKLHL
jgi:hypothetical protein